MGILCMTDNNIVQLNSPTQDVLGFVLKHGALRIHTRDIKTELDTLLSEYESQSLENKRSVVCNGYQRSLSIQKRLVDIEVRVPRGNKSHGSLVGCRNSEEYYGSRPEAHSESNGTTTEP